ncbi:MAG: hypothetical protein ABSF82_14880 [Candidatus Bathyarchaeia archaeon]|jgi:hypothetical protein
MKQQESFPSNLSVAILHKLGFCLGTGMQPRLEYIEVVKKVLGAAAKVLSS